MPPVHETQTRATPTQRVTPAAKPPSQQAPGHPGLSQKEQQLAAAMKKAAPGMPDWVVRAAVISHSEELRSRQQLQQDGVSGENAGRNDIYDAERHARWMYRLTAEVGAWAGTAIGGLKEGWGAVKGAGGAETAMDFHNNEVGRQAALKGEPIPDRHVTPQLVYIDETTGKLALNAERLRQRKALFRGKVSAAAALAAAAARKQLGGTTNLAPSEEGVALIKSYEKCKLTAYRDPGDPNGPWTIGWGSTGPDIKQGTVWTQQQADARMAADVADFATGVRTAIGDAPTTQAQFDAMVSLAYNIGVGAFKGSTVLKKHKEKDYGAAAAAFGLWIKNAGKTLKGLERRRAAEANLYKGSKNETPDPRGVPIPITPDML
ncbi:MAG: lysozyme [Sphingomonadales bacterium]|nr:lysozyme [Sphingomonadales bacterium]